MSYIDVNVLVEEILINDLVRNDYHVSWNMLAFSRCNDANYSILIYNDHLDAIIPVPLTMYWVDKLLWFSADELRNAPRKVWKVAESDAEIAGYIKTANKNRFFLAIIRNADDIFPHDQPRATLDLLERFLEAQPKYSNKYIK